MSATAPNYTGVDINAMLNRDHFDSLNAKYPGKADAGKLRPFTIIALFKLDSGNPSPKIELNQENKIATKHESLLQKGVLFSFSQFGIGIVKAKVVTAPNAVPDARIGNAIAVSNPFADIFTKSVAGVPASGATPAVAAVDGEQEALATLYNGKITFMIGETHLLKDVVMSRFLGDKGCHGVNMVDLGNRFTMADKQNVIEISLAPGDYAGLDGQPGYQLFLQIRLDGYAIY
jgi:hypothetical protein